MLHVTFNSYNTYVTDSLYQWDLNRDLVINGLGLTTTPEIHFTNANMDRAIVRQATLEGGIITARIPNSLLQEALTVKAYVGLYEGEEFRTIEVVEIPVIAKARPLDYILEVSDEEVYSFKALENKVESAVQTVDTAITEMNNKLESYVPEISLTKVASDISIIMDSNIAERTAKITRINPNAIAIPVITFARLYSDPSDTNRSDLAVPVVVRGEYVFAYNVNKKDIVMKVDVYELGAN